jgi:hypothetical protein
MKKNFEILAFAAFIALGIFTSTSCRKEKVETAIDNLVTGQDVATTQALMEDDEDEILNEQVAGARGGCATVKFLKTKGVFPQTIVIDYPAAGCTDKKGRTRTGTLTVEVSADPTLKGSIITVKPTNFTIDGIKVEGTRTWTNNGKDAAGNKNLTRVVTGGKLTFPNGKVATFETNETLKQIAGAATADKSDDVVEITGTRNGVNRNGKTYSAEITTKLVKNFSCAHVVSGVVTITNDTSSRSIDFGDGSCDDKATVTLANGTTKEVTLKKWW